MGGEGGRIETRFCCYRGTFGNRTEKGNCLNEGGEGDTEGKSEGLMGGEGDKQEGWHSPIQVIM